MRPAEVEVSTQSAISSAHRQDAAAGPPVRLGPVLGGLAFVLPQTAIKKLRPEWRLTWYGAR